MNPHENTNEKKIQVGIVDDDAAFRELMMKTINRQSDLEVSLEVAGGFDLLQHRSTLPALDVILMDIIMPDMDGIEATEKVLRICPGVKVIALTHYCQDQHIEIMYGLGARSFIAKGDVHELLKAIRVVNHGGAYITDPALAIIQSRLALGHDNPSPPKPKSILRDLQKQALEFIGMKKE